MSAVRTRLSEFTRKLMEIIRSEGSAELVRSGIRVRPGAYGGVLGDMWINLLFTVPCEEYDLSPEGEESRMGVYCISEAVLSYMYEDELYDLLWDHKREEAERLCEELTSLFDGRTVELAGTEYTLSVERASKMQDRENVACNMLIRLES
ncbi:MAG: hypothetical protein QXU26_02650 [Thermofilaceae archaeon]